MKVYFFLTSSIVLLLLAAWLVLRLIRLTERTVPWLLISAALLIMAVERVLELYAAVIGAGAPLLLNVTFELIAFCSALVMVAGLAAVSPLLTLRRSHERLRRQYEMILNSAGEGILGLDPEGKISFVNPAVRITGYETADLIGRNFHDTLHYARADGSPCPASECPICVVLSGGEPCSKTGEVFWRKDGASFPVDYVASPIMENGVRSGAVIAFRDVSQRELLERQLLQAQKMEAVGRLAGGVAHDFNNMLAVVVWSAQMMMADMAESHPLHQHLEAIKKAADRAIGLTRKLLAFSRKQVVQPQVLDLNNVITDLRTMLKRLISEDIELVTALDPGLKAVRSDAAQIEQVIMNLAINARDAMPQGGKLTIETRNVFLDGTYTDQHLEVAPGPYVMLAVSDNGEGMEAETLNHIFEPFFTTKEEGKGTGLGLATVYGIVKQSRGHIWVYSEPGQGTAFKIYFPLIQEAVAPAPAGPAPARDVSGWETILVVEDEEMLRQLVGDTLKGLGYQVLAAANGEAALKTCEEHEGPIHLLLTDVVMPQMGGRELAERLAPLYPEIKVIYMSGYADDAVVHHGVLEPTMSFIPKPFAPADLLRKVRQVLDGESA